MTLTEFLLARIAEDEYTAARVNPDPEVWLPIHRPARLLAEVEAKRRIVGRLACEDDTCGDRDCEIIREDRRILAAVYADHPDYREGWRVA